VHLLYPQRRLALRLHLRQHLVHGAIDDARHRTAAWTVGSKHRSARGAHGRVCVCVWGGVLVWVAPPTPCAGWHSRAGHAHARTCRVAPLQQQHDGAVVHPRGQHHGAVPQLVALAQDVKPPGEPALRHTARIDSCARLWGWLGWCRTQEGVLSDNA
jgi:hypothetical protein